MVSLEVSVTHDYMGPMTQWIKQAQTMFKDILGDEQQEQQKENSVEIEFLRFRTKKQEFMIVPDSTYLLIVIMNLLDK